MKASPFYESTCHKESTFFPRPSDWYRIMVLISPAYRSPLVVCLGLAHSKLFEALEKVPTPAHKHLSTL